ncbi:S-layer domain-containing protein [Anoxybacillus flavithermus NBRC 109594]|uniref:S-layer domain-containing protein n=1 Tax=Anoxybacillus flavithermus NBRC 109594 TaxID=1315967 RepID=R4G6A9_9BACL|nr:S-layer homology domain-containing protein [Anoxybacillus flavithermus]GAC90612.1 S-layer domain-containing protein [Anoxybacillus flavithermus NBRC 109594]
MAYQPKSYRKFLAGTVSAAVVASAIAPVASASFTDVAGSVHADDIATLVAKGYIKGYADGTFKPNKSLTRGEAAIIFSRILKDAGVTQKGAGFPDVPASNAELAEAVAIVQAAGVMGGDEKGNFNPNANITREQMAKVVVEAFKLTKPANHTTKITDLDKAGSWAREYIQTLEANGVTKNTEFAPKQNVTRGQFASFVVRAMDVKKEVSAADITAVKLVDEKTLEVTFNGELKEVKKEDFAIEGVEIESVSIKAAAAAEAKTTVVVIKTKTPLEEGKTYSVSYKGQTTDKAKVDVPVVTPKVESVSAINASQIVVKFNKAVDKATAETTANYVLTKADGNTIAVTRAKVKEDGKSVLLTVTPITTKTTFTLTVKNVKLNGSLTEEFPLYSQVLTVEDKVNPEIADVVSKTNSDVATSVTVYFTEPVTAGAIKIDGVTKAYSLATDGMSATISGLSLDANKSHTLEIVNLTDTANNVNTLVSKTFNVTKDVTAPTFTVSTESDNKIVLTFDKAVDVNTINTTNIVLKDEKLDTVAGYGVSVPTGYDNKRVEITLPAGTYSSKDSRTFTIMTFDGVKDYLGNKLAPTTKTVTINKDVTAPKLTSVEYVKDSTGKVTSVLFKYDEKVVETANLGLAAKDIVTGASVDLFGTLADSDVAVLSDGKTVKVDVKGAAVVKSGKLEISVPANFVKDTALTANGSKAEKLVVDFGAGTTAELKVQSVTNPDRNQYVVTFTDVVTYASATNPANYTINGVALPANTTIVFDTTNKNKVTITLPAGFITADDTGAVLRVQNVETVTGTKVSANTNVITVDDNAGPVIVKEKSQINANGTLSIGFSESVIAASASALSDLVFTINGSTVTVGNGNVTVVDGTGSDAGKYVVTFHTDVTSDANGKYYEYFDINGNNTLDATDIIVTTSTSALTPGVFNLNSVSSLKVGTVASPSVITDTNTYSGAPAANTIVEKQSVVIK